MGALTPTEGARAPSHPQSETGRAAPVRTEHSLAATQDCRVTPGQRGSGPEASPLRLRVGSVVGLALLFSRTPVQPSLQPSDKLGQVGDFDVEITNVDVPRNLRQVDVFHGRHSPGRGCCEAALRRDERWA